MGRYHHLRFRLSVMGGQSDGIPVASAALQDVHTMSNRCSALSFC